VRPSFRTCSLHATVTDVMPPARQKLRNGTWIIPSTGERTRRAFTLRHPNLDGPGDDDAMRSLADRPTLKEKAHAALYNVKLAGRGVWTWANSPKGRGTIKCSIAYLLASMGTFFHPAAAFLGPMDGKHIVATICTYFHPARSMGSQMEAVAIAVVGVLYAMFIGTMSMGTSVLFGSVLDMVELSYVLILVVFIGGGLGFVGWTKQKLNNPLVSVGASIASIGIITIVTKENSVHTGVFTNQKIIQSLKILLMATTISTLVNLLIWPVSARSALRNSMRTASTSLGDMLNMISHSFICGNEEEFASKGFTKASATYTSTLSQMNKNAREAKFEYYLLGRERIYKRDRALVKSMESLAQSIGGLRSAANTQFELLKEKNNGQPLASPVSAEYRMFTPSQGTSSMPAIASYFSSSPAQVGGPVGGPVGKLSSIREAPNERSDQEDEVPTTPNRPTSSDQPTPPPSSLKTPPEIFELFIVRLGPPMKSLVHTMAEILNEPPYKGPGAPVVLPEQFKDSLADAISLFNEARGKSLEELYKAIEFNKARPEYVQADFEEVAAACGHFSFSLLHFGDEMQRYLDAVDDLRYVTEQDKRTWSWMLFWRKLSLRRPKQKNSDPEGLALLQPIRRMRQSALPRGIPDTMQKRRDTFSWDAAPVNNGLWNEIVRAVSKSLLSVFRFLARDDSMFAFPIISLNLSYYCLGF
jgi:hypothetical protein